MRNGMWASASCTLRFSSTMTRTLSTPVAGDAVRGAICEELEPGVGVEFAVEPVQAVSPSEIASTEAAAPCHPSGKPTSLADGHDLSSGSRPDSCSQEEPLSVNDAQPV